jgi:2-methylcitrate dehydratase PrpD
VNATGSGIKKNQAPGSRCIDSVVGLVESASMTTIAAGALERAKASMVDTVGVALAGSATDASRMLRSVYTAHAGESASVTLAGAADRPSLLNGVLCNAYAAHALDFDDTIQGVTTHPSCHLVPALLALVETQVPATTVGEFMLAYLVGIEVEGRLAKAVNPAHSRRGWHTTGTLGTIAAAAAGARLLALPSSQTRAAIAIACSSASGLRANFGTPVKPLHAALAARAAVESVLLAKAGFYGTRDPFEHQFGFFTAYLSEGATVNWSEFDLPRMVECATAFELTLKPYPCCGEATSLVQGALELGICGSAADIAVVRLGLTPFAREILEFDSPTSADQARFSAGYCVAAALTRGSLGIKDFAEDALADPEVRALMSRVTAEVDPSVSGHGGSVHVTMASGQEHHSHVKVPVGHASIGMAPEAARAKFEDCAQAVLDAGAAHGRYCDLVGLDLEDRAAELLRSMGALSRVRRRLHHLF